MRRSLATAVSTIAVSLPVFSLSACGCNCAKQAALATTTVGITTSQESTTTTEPPTTTTIPSTYVIKRGDRLSDIAKMFGLTVAELVAANHITNPDKILWGTTLIIPQPGSIPTTTTTLAPTTTTTIAPPATTLGLSTTTRG